MRRNHRHAHIERRVHYADTIRPDDAHVSLARDGRQALLLRDAVLLAGLGIVLLSRKITKPTGGFRLDRRECASL